MAIRRFDDMNSWFDEMNAMFDAMRSRTGEGWMGDYERDAATHLVEEDGEYLFVMDLPGFEREDIDLTFDEGYIHVHAVHEAGDETSFRTRRVSERMHIPKEIVVEEISASYRNGVLEVHLPLVETEEEPSGYDIDIQD